RGSSRLLPRSYGGGRFQMEFRRGGCGTGDPLGHEGQAIFGIGGLSGRRPREKREVETRPAPARFPRVPGRLVWGRASRHPQTQSPAHISEPWTRGWGRQSIVNPGSWRRDLRGCLLRMTSPKLPLRSSTYCSRRGSRAYLLPRRLERCSGDWSVTLRASAESRPTCSSCSTVTGGAIPLRAGNLPLFAHTFIPV